jgi:hypothetical protein
MDISQLTPEMQQAVSPLAGPQEPSALPISQDNPLAQPLMPAGQTPIPMRPAGQLGTNQAAPLTPQTEQNVPGSRVLGDAPLSFSQKIARAADKLQIPNKPGGWAINLVGAAQHALSGAMDTLGDASAAASQARPGEGALAALGHIKNAETQRKQVQQKAETEQQRDQALIAKTNVDTHYQETLLHSLQGKLADEANDRAIANGKIVFDALTQGDPDHGVPGAPVISKNISEAQAAKALNDGTWNPAKESMQETGKELVYENGKQKLDSDGNPMWAKRYSIAGIPPEITLGPEQVKFLTDNNVLQSNGKPWDEGQPMPGALALSQFQQAHNNQALLEKQKDDRAAAGLADASRDQKVASLDAKNNLGPDFFHVVAQAGSLQQIQDFVTGKHVISAPEVGPDGKPTGRNTVQVDPRSAQFAQEHPNAETDVINWAGGLKDYKTQYDKEQLEIKKARETGAPKNVNEAQAAVTTATIANRDNPTPENQRAVLDATSRLEDLKRVDVDQKYADASQRVKATRDAETDDLKTVAAELVKPDNLTALKDISSMRGDERLRLYTEAKKIDPKFDPGVTNNKIRFLGQFTNPSGKTMAGITSNNTFLEHAGDLAEVNSKYARTGSPFINSPLNKMRGTALGDEAFTDFMAALNPVRTEYTSALAAGFASKAEDVAAANTIMNDASSPKQIAAAVRQMAHTVLRRADSTNENYRTIMGGNYPDLITPSAKEAVDSLGDDTLKGLVNRFSTGGKIGNAPQVAPSSGSPASKVHAVMGDFKQSTPTKEHGLLYTDDGKTWYTHDGNIYGGK